MRSGLNEPKYHLLGPMHRATHVFMLKDANQPAPCHLADKRGSMGTLQTLEIMLALLQFAMKDYT